ncbi:pimeloyl-ACP methyl ester esterase BioH [Thiomicrospira microaerophila]|uniref:pimeloyl-ACP methyl ester esterase BioH n=1 Tax=Thiomicrospira microaerophila TaxID=406020 RepID=UPI000AA9792D|nr:pimeloyl-ACP methyl ester esterase BioH [Thiomicrospira microaerophila]
MKQQNQKILKLYTHTFGQGPSLTLIHGWGAQSAVWRDWAQSRLAADFQLTLIDLPGFGESSAIENKVDVNQAWLSALADVLPENTHLLGWSLGGLMAQQLACLYPEKVKTLTCLASTPRFVQADDWAYGISMPLMADFIKALGLDSAALLNRFWKLQLQGGDGARQLMKHFVSQMQNRQLPSFQGLQQGLHLLRDLDLRDRLGDIHQPTLWLLGEKDPLVPLAITQDLIACQSHAKVCVIEGAAHVPFFSHPEQTAAALIGFLKEQHVSV